jgi:xanthine phosphoribosyltransferase
MSTRRLHLFCLEVTALLQLEQRIIADGKILPGGILKVDSFLNHQMDIALFSDMAREFHTLFGAENVSKILTIEASGIGLACITAQVFGCPVLFAKKNRTRNLHGEFLVAEVESYTHGTTNTILVSKELLSPDDRVLIIDDFLANGSALGGLISLCKDAGATVVGAGIAIEKAFQPGGDIIRSMGCRVESLARIQSMGDDGSIEFI